MVKDNNNVQQWRPLWRLSLDELKSLYKNNTMFRDKVDMVASSHNLDNQLEDFNEIFGKDNHTYEYHGNYTSFFLTLKDVEGFVDSLASSAREYLTIENQVLYDEARSLTDEWQSLTDEERDDDELWNALERACKELLEGIEEQLRMYETITDTGIEAELQAIIDDASAMSGWRTDGMVVLETIEKIYK